MQSKASSDSQFRRLETVRNNRGLIMISYLFPVLVLSFVMVLLDHRTITSNKRLVSETNPGLKQITWSGRRSQTRHKEKLRLDFIVAGFPKCGTTTLLYAFMKHCETAIAPREFCGMNGSGKPENRIIALNKALEEINSTSEYSTSEYPVRYGIKCPMAIWDTRGIELISANFKYIKIIVGVRHPVLFFQSFYNYRVTEMYDKNEIEKVPLAIELVGSNSWRDVSTDLARYELSLMQLGKTPMSDVDLSDLAKHGKRLTPTRYKVFLYSIEQLDDDNEERAEAFRLDLQRFLRLEEPFPAFRKENMNRVIKPETIDICGERFRELRTILIQQGKKTTKWMKDFIQSDDVFVGGKEYFVSLIQKWGDDPCPT